MVKVKGVADDMIANNLQPGYYPHPGEVLKDEIIYRGLSQRRVAQEIGVTVSQLNEVLNGKRALNAEMAIVLCTYLDIDAEPLLTMQMHYNMAQARKNPKIITQLNKLAQHVAVL